MSEEANLPWGTVDTRFEDIHSFARRRDVDAVRGELARGVAVDVLNGKHPNGDGGNTALWFAAQGPAPDGLPVVELLVAAGADINRACEHGYTALHMAAQWGHLDVVRFLVDSGAHPRPVSDRDGTPADMARRRGHQRIVEFLDSRVE